MGMNRDMIGFVYPDSKPVLVTQEHIADFANAAMCSWVTKTGFESG